MAKYRFHSLSIADDTAGVSPVHLPDIVDFSDPFNPEIVADLTSPNTSPNHIAFNAIKPQPTFSTYALQDAFDELGVSGRPIESSSQTGLVAYLQKLDDLHQAQAGSVHRSIIYNNGLLLPTRLTVDSRGDARLEMTMISVSTDGSTAPVTVADNAALPTIAITSARWTIGQMTVSGVSLSDYTGLEIDFGNGATGNAACSNIYDDHIEQAPHEPSITIRGIDPAWFGSSGIGLAGDAATHANTILYLRKRTQDGTHFVANGTAEHIKFTMAGLSAIDDAATGQAIRISETSLRITGAVDSSGNAPLSVTTASAIT